MHGFFSCYADVTPTPFSCYAAPTRGYVQKLRGHIFTYAAQSADHPSL